MRMPGVKITSAIASIAFIFSLSGLTGCGGSPSSSAPVQPVTPTGPASGSEFIYSINSGSDLQVAPLNPTTGEIGAAVVATQNLPAFPDEAAAAQYGNFIYLVGDDGISKYSAVWVFSISGANGQLTLVDNSPYGIAGAANPYYNLMMDSPHGRLFTAGMAQGQDGDIDVFLINPYSIDPGNGNLIAGNSLHLDTTNQGWVTDPAIDPLGRFIYAYGSSPAGEGIFGFTIDPTTEAVSQIAGSPFPPTFAPTLPSSSNLQLLVSPSGNFLNVIVPGDTYVLAIDPKSGALTPIANSPFPNNALGTLAVMTLDSEFMFAGGVVPLASGGFSTVIQTFAVDSADGTIVTTSLSNATSTEGTNKFIQIDPTGSVLIAPNIPDIWSFTIDQSTGALTSVAGSPFTLPGDPQGAQKTLIVKIP
jgi:hypothetical protein